MNIENQLLEKVKKALASEHSLEIVISLGPIPDSAIDDVVKARTQILFRFWDVYCSFIKQTSSSLDFLVLLRQLIRTYGSMQVHVGTWDRISGNASEFNLIERSLGNDKVEVGASDWHSDWLSTYP